jgi:heme o synthase
MINYALLMKPGILIGNLITMAAGFALGGKGPFDFGLFFAAVFGLGFIMASGCVFNNVFDKSIDQKMKRTQNRPIPSGAISPARAVAIGIGLLLMGNLILAYMTNPLALMAADIGFVIYVIFYTLLKKSTLYGTVIGSMAGAVPPVVGYVAAGSEVDMGAFLLFMVLVFWQMAHFYSIALFHIEEYRAAEIPVLPLVKGIFQTKIHIILYIMAFMGTASLLTFTGYTGYGFLCLVWILGLFWLQLAFQGLQTESNFLWAKKMFRCSLVLITLLSGAIIIF